MLFDKYFFFQHSSVIHVRNDDVLILHTIKKQKHIFNVFGVILGFICIILKISLWMKDDIEKNHCRYIVFTTEYINTFKINTDLKHNIFYILSHSRCDCMYLIVALD